MSKIFTASFSQFVNIISYIKTGLFSLGCSEETVNRAHIICDEFISNIIKNAYDAGVSADCFVDGVNYHKPLKISYIKAANRISIRVTDWGEPFNPLEYSRNPSLEGAHGGFGIQIAKDLSDSITYKRESGKNILTFFLSMED